MDGEGLAAESAAPRLGEHTQTVLANLGYGAGEIDRLRTAGVVG